MVTSNPSISVVMPYYRNERTLVASISSFAQQQGASAHEIIVVDDGETSTANDLVRSIVWPVAVRVLRSHRGGQSAATNMGIQKASGQLVLLTCADIVASPGLLTEHLIAHKHASDIGVMGRIAYAPWIPMTPIMQFLQNPGVQFNFESIINTENVGGQMLYAPHFSTAKATLMRAGLFDERLTYGYQDCDLGLRLGALGIRCVYREKALVWHDHPNTVRGYADRQFQVNTLWAQMAKRYPAMAKLGTIDALLDHYVPRLPALASVVALGERANSQWPPGVNATHANCQKLFVLFDTIGHLAMVQGIISDLEALEDVISVRNKPWYSNIANKRTTTAKGDASCALPG